MKTFKTVLPIVLVVLVAGLVLFVARSQRARDEEEPPAVQRPETPPPVVRTLEKASLMSGAQDWLPAETCLFLTVWHPRAARASADELGLSRILRSEEMRAFLDRHAAGSGRLGRLIRLARLIWRWPEHVPEQAAFALFRDRSWVLASRVAGEAKASELTRILGQLLEEEPVSASAGTTKVGPLLARHIDGWHVVGPDSGTAKSVRPGGAPGLSSVAEYRMIASRMPPGEAFGYFNPAFVPGAVPDEVGLKTLKAAGWSCRADGLSVRDSFFFWAPGTRAGVFKAFSGGELSRKVADVLPAETSIALLADVFWLNAYVDLKRVAMPWLGGKAGKEFDSYTQAAELALGCPVEDALRWLGQQSAFAVIVPHHSSTPKTLVVLEAKNLPRLEPALEKLRGWFALVSGGKEIELQLAGVDVRGFDTRFALFRSPCYAVRDGYLIASTHADALRVALSQREGSLAADEGFRRLSRALPVRRSGMICVDWPELFLATYEWALPKVFGRLYPPHKAREERLQAPAADVFLPHIEVMGGCLWSDEQGLGVDSVTTCGLPSLMLGAALTARAVHEPSNP